MFGYNLTHVVTYFIRERMCTTNCIYVRTAGVYIWMYATNARREILCEYLHNKNNISLEIHSINENDNMRLSIYFAPNILIYFKINILFLNIVVMPICKYAQCVQDKLTTDRFILKYLLYYCDILNKEIKIKSVQKVDIIEMFTSSYLTFTKCGDRRLLIKPKLNSFFSPLILMRRKSIRYKVVKIPNIVIDGHGK